MKACTWLELILVFDVIPFCIRFWAAHLIPFSSYAATFCNTSRLLTCFQHQLFYWIPCFAKKDKLEHRILLSRSLSDDATVRREDGVSRLGAYSTKYIEHTLSLEHLPALRNKIIPNVHVCIDNMCYSGRYTKQFY